MSEIKLSNGRSIGDRAVKAQTAVYQKTYSDVRGDESIAPGNSRGSEVSMR